VKPKTSCIEASESLKIKKDWRKETKTPSCSGQSRWWDLLSIETGT